MRLQRPAHGEWQRPRMPMLAGEAQVLEVQMPQDGRLALVLVLRDGEALHLRLELGEVEEDRVQAGEVLRQAGEVRDPVPVAGEGRVQTEPPMAGTCSCCVCF